MKKQKILAAVCAIFSAGAVLATAAAPAQIMPQEAIFVRRGGSEFTYIYPAIEAESALAGLRMNQYFLNEKDREALHFDGQTDNSRIKRAYQVMLNDGDYVSIIDTGMSYTQGDAHPLSWKHGVTFNVATGKQVQWQYMLNDETASQLTLAKINAMLRQSGYALAPDFAGLQTLPQNFYVDGQRNIHFLFNPYEIAPYAAGIIDLNTHVRAQ